MSRRVTRITRIVMKGFKSFNKKTELVFGKGFNCVLGPNGAGKSNVFDSLIFVLGKSGSKGMRAEKSANLIYNGGKTKDPAKQGEVTIFFDNTNEIFGIGTPELEIKRIITKSGASKYFINGKSHTRQQVLELLSRAKIDPNSHNIILQGDIVQLVELSPIEKRGMIEEIAGISIYEEKKEKALRELNRVQEKLNEAEIILTERKSYLRELKKERDQALKFKELDDKIKRNKATLLYLRMKEKKQEIDKYDKQAADHEIKIDKLQKEIEKIQGKILKGKEGADAINKEIEEKGEKEQVDMHKQVEQLRVDLALRQERSRNLQVELQRVAERRSELEKNLTEIESRIKNIEKDSSSTDSRIQKKESQIKELEAKISQHRKKNNLEDAQEVDKRIEEIEKEADVAQESINKLREEQQKLLREKDSFEIQLQGIDDKIARVLSLEKENKSALQQLKHDKERLTKDSHELNQCLEKDSKLASELDNARMSMGSRREELSRLEAQSAAIREGVAGADAIKSILNSGWKGIHGTISDLGSVDSKYGMAMEVAAGARIRSIVVENDEVAAKCINHLKSKKLGVATFLPLNKLKPQLIKAEVRNLKGKGVYGLAIDLINYDKQYEKAFQYVFANTLVVDNIDVARKIGVGTTRMVTLEGDLIESSGAMQGGHRARRKGLGFQSKDVIEKINVLKEEVSDLESVVSKLVTDRRVNETRIEKLRAEKAELEGNVIKIEKSLHFDSKDTDASKDKKKKMSEELKDADKKLSEIQRDVVVQTQILTKLKIERQQLREKLSNLRNPAVLAELNSYEEKKNELKAEIAEIRGETRSFDSEISNVLLPEKESIAKILKQQDKEKKDFEQEQSKVKKEIERQLKELSNMEEKEKKFYSQFKGLFEKRQKLGEEVAKQEGDILNKNDRIRESENKKNVVSLENARVKAEYSGLEEDYKQYEGVSVYRDKDEIHIKKEVDDFERMASGIGAVNMKALEIYDQVEKEYNSLLEKKDMLGNEREDVLVMINKIDSRKKDLFMKSFDALNANFNRIFGLLSTKGYADLELEDKKDPFNGGVNLRVRLSGKKYMDIRSLSGGEKTMTALAFIFAVNEYEPAPFYILDEVDAALDKRNSEKLASLIRSYGHKAQYIIISHNDAIISEADGLYGVSMNEHGESKVTSLKI